MKTKKIGGDYALMVFRHPRTGYPVNMTLTKAMPIDGLETAKNLYADWLAEYADAIHSVVLLRRSRQLYRQGYFVQVEYEVIQKAVDDQYAKFWTVIVVGWKRENEQDLVCLGRAERRK
ncbi:MAG: hypothetical protein IJG38_02370 [Thermoguttaceae bacterium]|nr:hypothetical protein [Thermoguttaceae bacterium]